MNNPYKSPEANLGNDSEFKRSVWWKIYFFLITILAAFGMLSFLADPAAGIAEYVSLLLWFNATIGLFGFTFVKPIYKPNFWFWVLGVYFLFGITYYLITDIDLRMDMNDTEFYVSTAVGWLFGLPTYYALYAYSRPSDPTWKNT